MPMYMNSKGDIFNVAPRGNISFVKDTFEIDELMAPIIAILMKKGYMTRACCSGHITSAYCSNYDDCIEDPTVQYEVAKCTMVDQPYIMFEDDIELPLDDLPEEWEWELNTPRSNNIDTEEDARLSRQSSFKPREIVPVFSKIKGGFNLCIRPDWKYFGFHRDDCPDKYKEDPYSLYAKLVMAHNSLFKWANSLPDIHKEIHINRMRKSVGLDH